MSSRKEIALALTVFSLLVLGSYIVSPTNTDTGEAHAFEANVDQDISTVRMSLSVSEEDFIPEMLYCESNALEYLFKEKKTLNGIMVPQFLNELVKAGVDEITVDFNRINETTFSTVSFSPYMGGLKQSVSKPDFIKETKQLLSSAASLCQTKIKRKKDIIESWDTPDSKTSI